MYNNLKSHQFLSCIFVLVLATGCQFDFTKTRQTRKEVKKLEKVAAAAYKKIQGYGYIEQESSKTGTAEDKSISILGITNPSNEIKTLYKKITDAISAAEIKDATLATVSAQLEFLIFETALLQVYAYAIEAYEACIQGSTVVDRATITRQIKQVVEVKDQGPQEPALQKVQAALTQLKALVKQIKTKARKDVGAAVKAAADAQGLAAIKEVKTAVIPIKVELDRIISKQDADAPTAVKAVKEAQPLFNVLQAILRAQKAVEAATKETVEEAGKAVEEAEKAVEEAEKAVEVNASLAEAIEKAVKALETQLQEAKKKLPKGDAQNSKAESSPARPGGDQGGGNEAASASDAQTPDQSTTSLEGSELTSKKEKLQRSLLQEQQKAVKRFRESVIAMFSIAQVKKLLNASDSPRAALDRLIALWDIVKVSILDDYSVIDSWIKNSVSKVLPPSRMVKESIATEFINSLNVNKAAIDNVMTALTRWQTDHSEQTDITLQQVTKVTEFFALAQDFSPPDSQSGSTAQSTPNLSTA